jgi:hypothetical protein
MSIHRESLGKYLYDESMQLRELKMRDIPERVAPQITGSLGKRVTGDLFIQIFGKGLLHNLRIHITSRFHLALDGGEKENILVSVRVEHVML